MSVNANATASTEIQVIRVRKGKVLLTTSRGESYWLWEGDTLEVKLNVKVDVDP